MADFTNIFPNKEQFDTMNLLLAAIASGAGGAGVDGWGSIGTLVRHGLHKNKFSIGDRIETDRATSVTAAVGVGTGITAVALDDSKFLATIGEVREGIYEFNYDGVVWRIAGGKAILPGEYGLTLTGTPAEGDSVIVTVTTGKLVFDLLDIDKCSPSNHALKNTLVLGTHDIFTSGTFPFDAPELMYWAGNGLPAGNYRFTLDHACFGSETNYDGTYMFTLTTPIPANGGFRHTKPIGAWKVNYAKSDVIGRYITTYGAAPARTEIERNVAVSEWDGVTTCTDLGKFTANDRAYYVENDSAHGGKRNFLHRQANGSNRWRDSACRQWLNSDAPAVEPGSGTVSNWWEPKSVFDLPPAGAAQAGFLHGIDPELLAIIGEVEVKTALPLCDITDQNVKYETTLDKVFLQSMTEIMGQTNNDVSEGEQFAFWEGVGNQGRIKYTQNNVKYYWWTRSPAMTSGYSVRNIGSAGTLGNDGACGDEGMVPTICIVG